MKSYFNGLLLNLQFFSIIPVRRQISMDDNHFEKAIRMFPTLGIIFGAIYALTTFVLVEYTPFSMFLIAFILWLLTIVLCGGIHIDAWMDTSDAFFSYQDKERRLEIMSDPNVGAFGVIGGIILLTTKFVLIFEVLSQYELVTIWLIFFIPVLSRTMMGFVLGFLPNVKTTGMGYLFQKAKSKHTFSFYLVYAIMSLVLLWLSLSLFIVFWSLALLTLIFFLLAKLKIKQWFGGVTGDVIGATTEGVEVYLWAIILLLHYFGMGLL